MVNLRPGPVHLVERVCRIGASVNRRHALARCCRPTIEFWLEPRRVCGLQPDGRGAGARRRSPAAALPDDCPPANQMTFGLQPGAVFNPVSKGRALRPHCRHGCVKASCNQPHAGSRIVSLAHLCLSLDNGTIGCIDKDLWNTLLALPLGLVAGVAVGLFYSPSSAPPVAGGSGLAANLSLTASGLGFLAGYGSRPFFDTLGSLLNTVFKVNGHDTRPTTGSAAGEGQHPSVDRQ